MIDVISYNCKICDMENIPNKIYLQIGDDADITVDKSINDFNDLYIGAITWSDERINENDIEYERKINNSNDH